MFSKVLYCKGINKRLHEGRGLKKQVCEANGGTFFSFLFGEGAWDADQTLLNLGLNIIFSQALIASDGSSINTYTNKVQHC